ncbi:asparagine synthase (glutamine-hydrolysing) [Hephaestia caeni]|uniref:asparagine synthase (glutamine-hydrolyzing) n=1 Tax=Hephaestia caeni TaxID=645617 RepID=A0A397PKX7_9SPHN|nr:asparagine synthetase B family protein [Hephaestia caeni]RIA46774.1 asparagine synthase (glutamine-hydrolysing) [Hephaestia caeni]
MTVGYLVIAGNRGSLKKLQHAPRLAPVHVSQNLSIWSDAAPIQVGHRGWVFGHLFTRTLPSRRVDQFSEDESRRICETAGEYLFEAYWGGYVAVFQDERGEVRVLRDPSGTVPCFFSQTDAALVVSNEAMPLIRLSRPVSNVNFHELARYIASPDWQGRETCLSSISELIGGEVLLLSARQIEIKTLWSPWKFVGQANSAGDPTEQLLDILSDTIGVWARCFEQIAIGVSGGLDSSIVAACSAPTDIGIQFFSMVGPDPDGDETRYANLLVAQLAAPLKQIPYEVAQVSIDRPTMPHQPRPSAAYFAQSIQVAHRALAADRSIDALFVGNGGDGVFNSSRTASPLTDRWMAEGLGYGLYETLRDIARLTDASFMEIVRQATRRHRVRATASQPKCDFTGLRKDMIDALGPPFKRHPWMNVTQTALPGKIAHVASIMRSQKNITFYRHGDGPPQIAPLLSQPIVETCLSIPTWDWISGGRDRAVARQAVKNLLPQPIIDRASKGGPDGFMHMLCRIRWRELTDFLRGGVLASEGLIDTDFLDRPFDPSWKGKTSARRLLAFGAAEGWARYWLRVGEEQ